MIFYQNTAFIFFKPAWLWAFYLFLFLGCDSNNTTPSDESGIDHKDPIDSRIEEPSVTLNFDPNYRFIQGVSGVQDRNFYIFTLTEKINYIAEKIQADTELQKIFKIRQLRIKKVLERPSSTHKDYAEALQFSDEEILQMLVELKANILRSPSGWEKFVNDHIGPSGVFEQFSEVKSLSRILQLAYEEALHGINQILRVYVGGAAPKYPEIDRASVDYQSEAYLLKLKTYWNQIESQENDMFFQPSLKMALYSLSLNGRDEAGRYYPMQDELNKETHKYIKTINWDSFEYAVIVVPGDAPDQPDDLPHISIGGMQRSDRAITLFKKGKAPLIAFLGGHMRPFQTPYSEGIEMKKYVMEKYKIPENKILVDPHSRHTTTNMRNIGRLIRRYKIPADKKCVLTTSAVQSSYVSSTRFSNRCIDEMKHIPMKLYSRLSDFEVEFTSTKEVLHLDSSDPLDP